MGCKSGGLLHSSQPAIREKGHAKFLPRVITDVPMIAAHEFSQRFHRSRSKVRPHRMSVYICIFHDQVTSASYQFTIDFQLLRNVRLSVILIKRNHDSFTGCDKILHLIDDCGRRRRA